MLERLILRKLRDEEITFLLMKNIQNNERYFS